MPESATSSEIDEFHVLTHRVARSLALLHFHDRECYALMYSAGRTRRKPWPHVHVLVARSVAQRRRGVLLLQLKHLLWWTRWPLVRYFVKQPDRRLRYGFDSTTRS